jgi:branched-chain amino acid aminotransferase
MAQCRHCKEKLAHGDAFSNDGKSMPHPFPILGKTDFAAWLDAAPAAHQQNYFAMFSNLLGGIITDPRRMLVPVDDHLVHRGDGVFDTAKCIAGNLYNLEAHLDRLEQAAAQIVLVPPMDRATLRAAIIATTRAGGRRDCLLRVLLGRGPGSLGINPRDCPQASLYILAYAGQPTFMQAHPGGARIITSRIPVKSGFLATTKTVNYLPNALMKLEASTAGVDFAAAFDAAGHLAEGATENFGIVTPEHFLRLPGPEHILAGTTMNRASALAADLVQSGLLRGVERGAITRAAALAAREVLIFGTTPDVTSVVAWDGQPIGAGTPGPLGMALNARLQRDMRENRQLLTPVWE